MAEDNPKEWAGTTYGNQWMHRNLINVLRWIDIRLIYGFAAIFVVPVCMIVNASGKIIYRYFRDRLGYSRIHSLWATYQNHCIFGQVVIDRFAMYAGKKFKIDIEGYEHFETLAQRKEGFIQLSAHIGNYELAGYSLVAPNKQFNALVFFGEKSSVMENRNKMFANTHIRMISIKPDMSHLFLIDTALQNGEIVSMPTDRIFGSPKFIRQSFLGKEAKFPLGPFAVTTMRELDVITVNVMKASHDSYKIYVTPLPYEKGKPRKEQMMQLSEAYTAELQRIVRMYPTQWFNYYDFWEQ